MKCNKCGVENAENIKFCTSCGVEMIAEKLEETSVIPSAVPASDEKPVEPKVEEVSPASVSPVQPAQTTVPPTPPVAAHATQPRQAAPVQTAPVQAAPQRPAQPQYQQPVQPQYQQPVQPQYQQAAPTVDKTKQPMTFGGWLWTLLVSIIPIVNFIFILVWSFSSGTNKSKQSWARVNLLFIVIFIVLSILMGLGVIAVGSILDGFIDSAIDSM